SIRGDDDLVARSPAAERDVHRVRGHPCVDEDLAALCGGALVAVDGGRIGEVERRQAVGGQALKVCATDAQSGAVVETDGHSSGPGASRLASSVPGVDG